MVEEKDIEDQIESVKPVKPEKSAVTRLLKHLKKARLQNYQYQETEKEKNLSMTAASAHLEVTSGMQVSSPNILKSRDVFTPSKSEENIGRFKNFPMQKNGLVGNNFGGKYSVVNPN